jgi:Fe-S-cluster-containing dehydrogenase component
MAERRNLNGRWGLVANLERCIGCFACEVACKQEHDLPEGEKYIAVETIGPYDLDGELAMDFMPLAKDGCDFCQRRLGLGKRPACVAVCPSHALGLYNKVAILRLLRGGPRIRVCKMGGDVPSLG